MGHKENKRKRAQTTLEFVVLVACIVGALLIMHHYIKRGIQGGLRKSADQIGAQYDPGNTEGLTATGIISDVTTVVTTPVEDGKMKIYTTVTSDETQTVEGEETVGPLGSSLF